MQLFTGCPSTSTVQAPQLVVSQPVAAWHDVYLVGLTMLLAAIALEGVWRRRVAVAGAVLAGIGVLIQAIVMP